MLEVDKMRHSVWFVLVCLAAFVLATPAARSAAAEEEPEVKRLFGFERDEIAEHGATIEEVEDAEVETITATFGTYRAIGTIEKDNASAGEWALVRTIADRWNWLLPDNETIYYERVRQGGVLKSWGWFYRVLGTDWSGYDRLWIDVFSEDGVLRVRTELEDDKLPEPVRRAFDVPKGRWVTLEIDLAAAVDAVHLDLENVRVLDMLVIERLDAPQGSRIRVDNIRLAREGAESEHPVLRDETPIKLKVHPVGDLVELEALDIARTEPPEEGAVGRIARERRAAYGLMSAMDRAIGRFGDGGVVLVMASQAFVSLDGGLTWTGLDGQPDGTLYSRDHRGHHRAAALVEGPNFFAAYTTNRCAGGAGRTANKFSRGVRGDERWTLGPEVVIDSSTRHCHAGFSLARTNEGILWSAWNHRGTDLSRRWALEARTRWSPDDGRTWLTTACNGIVGPQLPNSGGVLLAPVGEEQVAIFWRHGNRNLVMAHSEPIRLEVDEIQGDRVWLDGGSRQGLELGVEGLLTLPDDRHLVLRVISVEDERSETVVMGDAPGANEIEEGQEVVAMRWSSPITIADGDANRRGPCSATVVGDDLFVATSAHRHSPSSVYCYDGEQVTEVSPEGFEFPNPLLVNAGGKLAMVWREGENAVRFAIRNNDGGWSQPRAVLETEEPTQTLVAPQSADGFIPIAVGMADRQTLLTTAILLEAE